MGGCGRQISRSTSHVRQAGHRVNAGDQLNRLRRVRIFPATGSDAKEKKIRVSLRLIIINSMKRSDDARGPGLFLNVWHFQGLWAQVGEMEEREKSGRRAFHLISARRRPEARASQTLSLSRSLVPHCIHLYLAASFSLSAFCLAF